MLKALDMFGLICHINLICVAWTLETVPLVWQTVRAVINFKKGDQRVCSNHSETVSLGKET